MEKIFKVFNINWDVTDDDLSKKEQKEILKSLPKEIKVTITDTDVDNLDDNEEIENYIAEYLSDEIGYCHEGFNYKAIK